VLCQIPVHLRGVAAGEGPRDRAAIILLLALRALGPLWRLFGRLGLQVASPLALIRRYRITDGVNRWEVKGTEGAAYLFPRTELGNALDSVAVSSGVCIDVGASFGWYTVRWAQRLGVAGWVLAIEPDPRHYASLVRNVELNHFANVTTLPIAVGDRNGTLRLFSPSFGQTILDASAIPQSGLVESMDVPMRTIDGLVDELGLRDVRLVKIDVEDFEATVLRGMRRILDRDRPTIVFEAWTPEALEACRVELPNYVLHPLNEWDYVARPR
jgi:FkbM family methyltransferase